MTLSFSARFTRYAYPPAQIDLPFASRVFPRLLATARNSRFRTILRISPASIPVRTPLMIVLAGRQYRRSFQSHSDSSFISVPWERPRVLLEISR